MPISRSRLTRFKVGKNTYTFEYLQDWSANFGNLVPASSRLPGMHGAFDDYGNEPAPAETGNIALSFALSATDPTLMTAFIDEWNAVARWGRGRLYMQPADDTELERFCFARPNNIPTTHNLNRHSDLLMRINANFQVSDPHWYTQGTFPPTFGDGSKYGAGVKYGGGATPHACAGLQTDFTETRLGNALTRPIVVIQCGASQTAEDVTIQRLDGGAIMDELKYTGVLNNNDVLTINAWSMTVKLNGADGYTSRFIEPVNPDWFHLYSGTNTLRVKLKNAGDACNVTFKYYEAWV